MPGKYKDSNIGLNSQKILERGKFSTDFFIADVLGVYDVNLLWQLSTRVHHSAQILFNDPLLLVLAMALEIKTSRFGTYRVRLSFEHPDNSPAVSRPLIISTKGRAGWKIVTSYLNSGARNIGLSPGKVAHDDCYDVADEYMGVCHKLWEGNWEERRSAAGPGSAASFRDPAKVHPIGHDGAGTF